MDRKQYYEVVSEVNSIQDKLRSITKAIQHSTEVSDSEANVIRSKLNSIELTLIGVQNSLNAREVEK